jgi:hypothetical protein
MIADRSPATGDVQGSLFATLLAEMQSRDLPLSLFATLIARNKLDAKPRTYSTVTDLARLRG